MPTLSLTSRQFALIEQLVEAEWQGWTTATNGNREELQALTALVRNPPPTFNPSRLKLVLLRNLVEDSIDIRPTPLRRELLADILDALYPEPRIHASPDLIAAVNVHWSDPSVLVSKPKPELIPDAILGDWEPVEEPTGEDRDPPSPEALPTASALDMEALDLEPSDLSLNPWR